MKQGQDGSNFKALMFSKSSKNSAIISFKLPPLKTGIKKLLSILHHTYSKQLAHMSRWIQKLCFVLWNKWSSSRLHLRTGVTHCIYVLSRIFKTKTVFLLITKVQKQCCHITFKVWMLQNIYF